MDNPIAHQVIECSLPYIQDPQDRASISLVCKYWYELDRLSRRKIVINFCYSTTPQMLHNRFPNIDSLKIKGKPRASMFNLIPEDWGGFASVWVDHLRHFKRLTSIHFRRMILQDSDLETIATVKGNDLISLKLDICNGFSTNGLSHITRNCRNLRTLFLEDSNLNEINGEWLHHLALNNKVLENLSFYLTFMEHISVEDLELLAVNCPLVSVKIGDTALFDLGNFFRAATRLQEFCGGSYDGELIQYCDDFKIPAQLTSLGPMYMLESHLPMLYPVANSLLKLDLVYVTLTCDDHCLIIERCHNLQILEATEVIGDKGLKMVSLTCKRLKRLRIEPGDDTPQARVEVGGLTQAGLIAVAQGCHELEYLSVNVVDIGNEALVCVGTNLNNLKDFRLVLLSRSKDISDLPLDNGVRALLQGCQKIRRFALYLRSGGLTDNGLRYIGQFSQNVRWMLLGYVGETDAGLLDLSTGCPRLQKLEMRGCDFTEGAMSIAARRLTSLKFMWVQGYRSAQPNVNFNEMVRPYWHIELILEDQHFVNRHFLAYYSLAGQRTDYPTSVFPLANLAS